MHHRRLSAPRSAPRTFPSARHGARVVLVPLLRSRLHSLQVAPGLQQQARLARRHGSKVAASSAAAISIDSMPADGSPPSLPDTQIPAWNLRARWKAWWDLKVRAAASLNQMHAWKKHSDKPDAVTEAPST